MKNCAGSDQRTLKSGTFWKYLLNPTICSFWRGWINVLFWVFGGAVFFPSDTREASYKALHVQLQPTRVYINICFIM